MKESEAGLEKDNSGSNSNNDLNSLKTTLKFLGFQISREYFHLNYQI